MGEVKLLPPQPDVELVFSEGQREANFQRIVAMQRSGKLPASARQARLQGHPYYQGEEWDWLDTWKAGDRTPDDSVTRDESVTKVTGRPAKFRNAAEKQRAYRERRK